MLGFLDSSWIVLFLSGLLLDFWLGGASCNENCNAWYEVGELGRISSNLRIYCLNSCLNIGEEVEIGWLERVGGEGILKIGKGVCNTISKNEW